MIDRVFYSILICIIIALVARNAHLENRVVFTSGESKNMFCESKDLSFVYNTNDIHDTVISKGKIEYMSLTTSKGKELKIGSDDIGKFDCSEIKDRN